MAQARAVPDVASSYPRLARLVRILHPAEPVTEAPAAAWSTIVTKLGLVVFVFSETTGP